MAQILFAQNDSIGHIPYSRQNKPLSVTAPKDLKAKKQFLRVLYVVIWGPIKHLLVTNPVLCWRKDGDYMKV